MINDISKIDDLLKFARLEPESDDDLFEMMRKLPLAELRDAVQLGANLVGAGTRAMKERK
jgi:hypothetical protein